MKGRLLGFFVMAAGLALAEPVLSARQRVCDAQHAMSVVVAGSRLYLADGSSVKIFDVTQPEAPQRIGGIASGIAQIRQLAVKDGIVYAACRGQGVWIIDCRNPKDCKVLARYDSIELATGIDVVGDVCFIGQRQNGFECVDVRDPSRPRHIAARRTDECQSCRYADGFLYSGDWGGGYLTVFDARDLRDIRQTSRVELGGFGDGMAIDRERKLLFASTGHDARHRDVLGAEAEGRGRGIDVFSLEDRGQPKHLARLDLPPMKERLHDYWLCRVSGDRLYACDSHNGFFTVDVSDPAAPKILSREVFAPERKEWPSDCVSSCAVGDGCVYVTVNGKGGEEGLWVIPAPGAKAASDAHGAAPTHPEFRETPATDTSAFAVWTPGARGQVRAAAIVGESAYVACGDAGLWRVKLEPNGFGAARQLIERPVMDVVLDDAGCLATAEGCAGLALYELDASGCLKETKRTEAAYGLAEIYVWRLGRYLVGSSRFGGMRFYDLDDPSGNSRLVFVSKGDAGWEKPAPNAVFDGRYAVMNEGYGGVSWIDLGGPKPAFATRTTVNRLGPCRGLCRLDDKTALAWCGPGYGLLAANAPESGRWPLVKVPAQTSCGMPATDGKTLCKTYRISGDIELYDISDRQSPKPIGAWKVPGYPSAASFWRGRAVIPCGYQGLLLKKSGQFGQVYPGKGVTVVPSGVGTPWNGFDFTFAEGTRDYSDCGSFVMTISNRADRLERLMFSVRTGAEQGREPTETQMVPAGGVVRMKLLLKNMPWRLDAPVELKGMKGRPLAEGAASSFDLRQVRAFVACVAGSGRAPDFEVLSIEALEDGVEPKVLSAKTFLPFVDRFGQFKHDDWTGKVKSEEELRARGAESLREMAGLRPGIAGADRWGGWAEGPQLQATGHFRVEKYDGKWWFVDPDGHLFFSHGICHVKPENVGSVAGRENYFERPCEDFNVANLKLRYGADWKKVWLELTAARLNAWGINTTGDWSDPQFEQSHAVPYTAYFKTVAATRLKIVRSWWGSMRDPFAPDFEPDLRRNAELLQKRNAHEDPWCLGWFVDNELDFGKDEFALADSALAAPDEQPARREYLRFLKERGVDPKGKIPDGVRRAFSRRILEKYYSTVAAVMKEMAPKKLYLGSRIARGTDDAWEIAAKYCDVVSANIYSSTPAVEAPPSAVDRPYLVGEFHFGAMDRGMFTGGLGVSSDQFDRSMRYRDYVEAALRDPHFVGVHWFQWQDQPLAGRRQVGDAENYNIGFVNVTDDPYREMVAVARSVAARMYRLRAGSEELLRARGPFRTPPVGWMTWYAVGFDASEQTILANARAFKERFGDYLEEKPVLWVDWEWNHRKFESTGADGEDAFTPHAKSYPHGMKYLHDALADMGYTPALWIAPNAEGRTNDLLRAHNEWILESSEYWCGQITCDPTAPGFCEGYLRHALDLYRGWGYRAFKWDVMPHTYSMLKKHGAKIAARGYTPQAAFRDFVADCRRAMGDDAFFLYCHNMDTDYEEVLHQCLGEMDACRVGRDIFSWVDFIGHGLENLVKYLPHQSDVFWPDGDNLVLRPEYNSAAQARTRVTIYALSGLPLTVGDPVGQLDDERTAMLRMAMPVQPTWRQRRSYPETCDGKSFDMTVDFEDWTMRSFSNLSTNAVREVVFATEGKAVWDVWNRCLLSDGGQASVRQAVAPGDTLLVRLTPLSADGAETEVGNDRHLTQVVTAGMARVPYRRYFLKDGQVVERSCP